MSRVPFLFSLLNKIRVEYKNFLLDNHLAIFGNGYGTHSTDENPRVAVCVYC